MGERPTRHRLPKACLGLTLTLGAVLGCGTVALTPFGATALEEQALNTEERVLTVLEAHGIDYRGELIIRDELTVAGQAAAGYVPLVLAEDTIYLVSQEVFAEHGIEELFEPVVLHEYGHILQKRVLEERCEGNPLGAIPCILELNSILGSQTASTVESTPLVGIETGADCLLQTYGLRMDSSYQGSLCTVEQLAAALAIRKGLWPSEEQVTLNQEAAEELHELLKKEISKQRGIKGVSPRDALAKKADES